MFSCYVKRNYGRHRIHGKMRLDLSQASKCYSFPLVTVIFFYKTWSSFLKIAIHISLRVFSLFFWNSHFHTISYIMIDRKFKFKFSGTCVQTTKTRLCMYYSFAKCGIMNYNETSMTQFGNKRMLSHSTLQSVKFHQCF